MSRDPDRLARTLASADLDLESLTIIVAARATSAELAAALGEDPHRMPRAVRGQADLGDAGTAPYAIGDIAGGALALEPAGNGDPGPDTLHRLSGDGRVAAVARSDTQGHVRFGYYVDGEVRFDKSDFLNNRQSTALPAEVRELVLRARSVLKSRANDLDPDDFLIVLAMAEQVTGLQVTTDDLQRIYDGD